MFQHFLDTFVLVQGWLLEHLVQPPLLALGLGSYLEVAFDGIEFFLYGVLQLSIAYLLLRPLEYFRPIEDWPDRKAVRVDVLYAFLDRLGVIPLAVFVLLSPFFLSLDGWLRFHDVIPPQLEDAFPSLEKLPLLSFVIYLLLIDFAEYWRHRLSHTLRWWWALHVIHHSQRRMSLWTDSRNHLLDDLIGGAWFAVIALCIGVPPGHFIGLMVAVRIVENLSHVNARLSFGRIGERLLVSPRYHRWHHAIDLPKGGEYPYGCNFAILFPIWDRLFGTQYLSEELPATGVQSPILSAPAHADHFWKQQADGLSGLFKALKGTPGTLRH
jgi:sterol desaturase/sphingolipid hydroxylase (fatty acid hydroxylase superfamily)